MNYEQLGLFYLGKRYDTAARARTADPVLYDSSDLLTHAVCIGMTGSGKTGLGIALIEEAAIDGLPVLAIDPKGDLANLMLTFPGLSAAEFAPWVNPDEARAQQLTTEAFAEKEAARWKAGLAEWDEDGARIARLKAAADVAVYTPGSRAGLPLSVLETFNVPPRAVLDEPELLGDARRQNHNLDRAPLLGHAKSPPVPKIGVLELESFYPAADRFALAMRLNNLLAAPGFATWLEGEPLDVAKLLYTPSGKPRVAVVSIAHLGDAERMFFLALLLEQVLAWVRAQRGTTSLRAVFYMDELFGFLPPTANPPSKMPLLTLLKQARAFGLGCVLATQTPVDLDYKALSNAGTWFLGRLQTERDKARVLDGLEGVAAGSGQGFDRAGLDTLLSGLEKRVFLLHNVHDGAPITFQSRWALSYLRGPMGRDEIRTLMDPHRAPAAAPAASAPATPSAAAAATPAVAAVAAASPTPAAAAPPAVRPILPPDVPQYFAPGAGDTWVPMLVGAARVSYTDAKLKLDETNDIVMWTPLVDGPVAADWEHAEPADFAVDALKREAPPAGAYAPLPAAASKPKSFTGWTKDFSSWAARSQSVELFRSTKTGLTSHPGETEAAFRVRAAHDAREARDEAVAALRKKYATKVAALDEKIRKAGVAISKEEQQATESKFTTAVSVGASVLGALFGRKVVSATNAGRVASAARGMGKIGRESQDVERAKANEAALLEQKAELDATIAAEVQALQDEWSTDGEAFESVVVKPKRGGVQVQLVALVWRPE